MIICYTLDGTCESDQLMTYQLMEFFVLQLPYVEQSLAHLGKANVTMKLLLFKISFLPVVELYL